MRRPRRALISAAAATVLATTGCAATSGTPTDTSPTTYTFWDPYPQFGPTSAWAKRVASCGARQGLTIKRTAMDTTTLANQALSASQQQKAPDILVVDNPVVSTLAQADALKSTVDLGEDTTSIQNNILDAGTDFVPYGVPIGANTLALYYNKNVLGAAGVDPTSIKDWATLTSALRKVKAAGKKGITFSAIGTEEGTFQFLPWFWGAGGDLTRLDGPNGVAALTLWRNWVAQGLAPHDVLHNTQTTSWQEFATGNYAFGENGTWQLANAAKAGFPYGVINIPAQHGGPAPTPTGGEFVTVPRQRDYSRYTVDQGIVACLTSSANLFATDTTLSYVAPTDAVQAEQVQQNPALGPWVKAVATARGRTSNGLGTQYPIISQQLWKAVQEGVSGANDPVSALGDAQSAVETGVG